MPVVRQITVTRIYCRDCDTTIEGRFVGVLFAYPEQLAFVEMFVRNGGRINRLENELGLSYPTIRNRLHEVIRAWATSRGEEPRYFGRDAAAGFRGPGPGPDQRSRSDADVTRKRGIIMDKQSVSTGEAPHVFLQVHGNLHLKGSEDLEVTAKADSTQDLTLEQEGEEVRIRSNSNCTVRLPREAKLDVELVNGNAEIKAMDGELRILEWT
jgi:hypothetical protein